MLDRSLVEQVTKKCIGRLSFDVPESQTKALIERLCMLSSEKEAMDALALSVDRFFGKPEQAENFNFCMQDIMQIKPDIYKTVQELVAQMNENKAKNYMPGNIPVEENHRLIAETLKKVCDRLNSSGVDYYVVGALSTFIGTNTPLFRYHGDIDFMIAEKDIEKVAEAMQGTDYNFSDDRFDNKKVLRDGVGHTQGEHEVIANHKDNEFHLGFFLFRRELDNSITVREYFMQEDENGRRVPKVLERHEPAELATLEYSEEKKAFAGTEFRTSTPESVFAKKMSTQHPKDKLDIDALKGKVDLYKIKEMEKYQSTLKVVDAPIPEKSKPSKKPNVVSKDEEDYTK